MDMRKSLKSQRSSAEAMAKNSTQKDVSSRSFLDKAHGKLKMGRSFRVGDEQDMMMTNSKSEMGSPDKGARSQ